MNVIIYDTEHFETSSTLARLFAVPGNSVSLIVTTAMEAPLRELLKDSTDIKWKFITDGKTNAQEVYEYCRTNKADLLLLNTIAKHHLFFSWMATRLKNTKVWLTIHDVNTYFQPERKPGLRSWLRHIGIKSLVKNVNGYIVLLSSTQKFLLEKFNVRKEIVVLPGSIYRSGTAGPDKLETIKIVIPGSIDFKRRDYMQVEKLVAALHPILPVELVLLGTARTNKACEFLNRLAMEEKENLTIHIYKEDFISAVEYEHQLSMATLIWAPLSTEFREDGFSTEQYGLSKSSGGFFDAVRYGKLLVLSSEIPVPEELKLLVYKYATIDHLANWINELTESQMDPLWQLAKKGIANFTADHIRSSKPEWFRPGGSE
jgi:hypothetical protein